MRRSGLRTLGYVLDMQCRNTLVEEAVNALDAPMLTALHKPESVPQRLARRAR